MVWFSIYCRGWNRKNLWQRSTSAVLDQAAELLFRKDYQSLVMVRSYSYFHTCIFPFNIRTVTFIARNTCKPLQSTRMQISQKEKKKDSVVYGLGLPSINFSFIHSFLHEVLAFQIERSCHFSMPHLGFLGTGNFSCFQFMSIF